jgi:hypothetical protein
MACVTVYATYKLCSRQSPNYKRHHDLSDKWINWIKRRTVYHLVVLNPIWTVFISNNCQYQSLSSVNKSAFFIIIYEWKQMLQWRVGLCVSREGWRRSVWSNRHSEYIQQYKSNKNYGVKNCQAFTGRKLCEVEPQ